MGRSREILTGLASLITLLAVELGLPAVLTASVAVLAPSLGVSSLSDLLRPHTDGSGLILALVVVAAAGWLLFTVSLLIELAARARHVPAPRLRGLGGAQRTAAGLVAGIVLLLPTSGALLAAHPAPATAPTAISLSVSTASTTSGTAFQLAADTTSSTTSTGTGATTSYTVQTGDSLFKIAQNTLGDGSRWRQIAALNAERSFDGQAFNPDAPLQVGWTLTVPSTGAPSASTDAHSSTSEQTVKPGDSLWKIAEEDLGSGAAYTRIFTANQDRPQPDGLPELTDPALIYPGQQLAIPQDSATPATGPGTTQNPSDPTSSAAPTTAPPTAAAGTPSAAATAPTAGATAPASAPATETAPSTQAPTASSAAPSPGATSSTDASPSAQASPPAGAETQTRPAQTPHVSSADGLDTENLAGLILGGTLLTALVLLGALGTRRRLQHRTRRRTELIALPGREAADFENRVRAGHDPDGAGAVATALRLIAADAADRRTELPELAAVLYHPGSHLELRCADDADLPEPFTSVEGSRKWWTCQLADLRPGVGAVQDAPYPALAVLGVDQDGANLLVDLEALGALILTGPREQTTSVLRRMLLDLSGSTFADHLSILLAADTELLAGEVPGDRVSVYSSLEDALADLEHAASAAVDLLDGAGANTMRQIRPTGSLPEAEPTYILISDIPPTADQQQRLRALFEGPCAPPAAAILAAGSEPLDVPGWHIPVDAGPVLVAPAGATVTVTGLDDSTHEMLADLLAAANTTASVADPVWAEVLDTALTNGTNATGPYSRLPERSRPSAAKPEELDLAQLLSFVPALADFDPAPAESPAAGPDAVSGQQNDSVGSEFEFGPDMPDATAAEEAEAPATSTGPRVLLLGPVEVVDRAGADIPGREQRMTEMAAYLSLNPDGGHNALASALWPDSDNARHSELTRLRQWLGKDPAGEWYLPHRSYRMKAVSSDWADFLAHVADGNLPAAIALVRDQPLLGTPPKRYGWAEYDKQTMISKIADVAVSLARVNMADHEYEAARAAAMVGLKVSPENEELSRVAMEALLGAKRRSEAVALAERVVALCEDLGVDPEPETWDVIRRARGLQNATN